MEIITEPSQEFFFFFIVNESQHSTWNLFHVIVGGDSDDSAVQKPIITKAQGTQ